MRYSLFFLIVFILGSSLFALTEPALQYEQGVAVFKLKSQYKSAITFSSELTGISALDQKLGNIGVYSVKPRFQYDVSRQKAEAPDLSLIFQAFFAKELPPQAVINILKQDEHIQYAEPLYIDEAFASPDDPYYDASLYFVPLMAEAAWDIHKGENGTEPVVLAIMDTGINWKHLDIGANIWNNPGEDANGNGYTIYFNGSTWVYDPGDLNGIDDDGNGKVDDLIGWDFMLNEFGDQGHDPWEASGHGTTVAGIADARTDNGRGISSLAWNVLLMPLSGSHPSAPSSVYRGYEGILYAAEMGAHIINCSWGGQNYSQASQDLINYAASLGLVIIAAAGNNGNTIPIYPAAYQNVVAVGSVNNSGVKSSASNYGAYLDLVAPNQGVAAFSGSGYTVLNSGATSYAAPIASSLAALIKSQDPSRTREEVISRLIFSCDDVDAANPQKENMLGQGRLNAYRALTEVNPQPDDELRFSLMGAQALDANGNLAVEPGESFSLNILLRNHSWGVASNDVNITLSSSDSKVSILQNSINCSVEADAYLQLTDVFEVYVSPSATSKYVNFVLNISADKEVVLGSSLSFKILINGGGHFVWEPVASGANLSGTFIRNHFQNKGLPVVYGNSLPSSFHGFDGVWLSFGTVGSNLVRFEELNMYHALKDYLEAGGSLYLEGGDTVGFDMGYFLPDTGDGYSAAEKLWPLLGLLDADDGSTHSVQALSGEAGWISRDLFFGASNQTYNDYIDVFQPAADAYDALIEAAYGTVGIEYLGVYDQRVFLFSYALAELTDGEFPDTRAALLDRILAFFTDSAPLKPYIAIIPPEDELLLPQYMQGEYPLNNSRLPSAARLKLTGLLPEHQYRYIHQMVAQDEPKLSSGSGTSIFVDEMGNLSRVTNPSLKLPNSYGIFNTDSTGSFEGWFVIQSDEQPRFAAGTQLYHRILINDGMGSDQVFGFISSSSATQSLAFGNLAQSKYGTAVAGNSHASSLDYVFAYADEEGLLRPISASFIEASGLDFDASYYPAFYQNYISSIAGAYGLIIPNDVPDKEFSGIKRLEARAKEDASLKIAHTDSDGIWPDGADTINPSGGALNPIFFTPLDATLPVQLSSFTAQMLDDAALIKWKTESESNLAGYFLLKACNMELQNSQIISPLIPAQNSGISQSYSFQDSDIQAQTRYFYWLQTQDLDGSSFLQGPISLLINHIETEDPPQIPSQTALNPIFPNPFNPLATLSWNLRKPSDVSLKIFNLKGQKIHEQHWPKSQAGHFQYSFDASHLPSGVYLFVLDTADGLFLRKAVLMK